MSLRTFLYQTMINDPAITTLVPAERILVGQSLMTAQLVKPYIVFRAGNVTDEGAFDDPDIPARPNRSVYSLWIHDSRPSYVQIDTICSLLKQTFRVTQSSAADGIIGIKYLETSQDFDDVTLDTVYRYLRFQAIMV